LATTTFLLTGAIITLNKVATFTPPLGYLGTNPYVPGGTITFTITYINIGDAKGTNTIITDFIPDNTYYASQTLRIGTIGSTYDTAGTRTDTFDTDNAEFDNNKAIFRIGEVPIAEGGRVYFRVYVR
ncbi:MAG: hypothetical protein AB1595_00930, partial [bacterium]